MSGSRTKSVAREAYRALVAVAHADGQITTEERGVLERYRRALNLSAEEVGEIDEPGPDTDIPLSERVHILRMMYRVAYADGTCSERERTMLRKVADSLRLSRVQAADVEVAIDRQTRHRRRTRRLVGIAATVVVAAIVAVAVMIRATGTGVDGDAHEDILGLRTDLDQLAAERARHDAAVVQETTQQLEWVKSDLLDRIEDLENSGANGPASARETDRTMLEAELESLRRKLDGVLGREEAFKAIEKRYRSSVVLIGIRYLLTDGTQQHWMSGFGTGFFVTPNGLIVTSKHVVEPWKFESDTVKMLNEGFTLDEANVLRAAWPAGAEVRLERAYSSKAGTLRIASLTADSVETRVEWLSDSSPYQGRFHIQDNSDLALLQATLERPAQSLPLLTDVTQIEKLDPVMVLGFPTGLMILEQGRAETSPSLGEVRKVEDTVYVTSPIVPGNSGGPVLDRQGRVIGVATRSALGEATMGSCIQSRHILPLLPPTAELLSEVEHLITGGHAGAAEELLDLVAQRELEPSERTRLRELRTLAGTRSS